MEQINEKTGENVQVVLIANKIDLPDEMTDDENKKNENSEMQ